MYYIARTGGERSEGGMIDPKRKLNGDKLRRQSGTWSGVTGVSRERARRVLHNSIRYPRVPHPSPHLDVARTPQTDPYTSTPQPLPFLFSPQSI